MEWVCNYRETVEVCEMRPTDDGLGKRKTKVATRTGKIDLLIDREKLREYARKALESRSGKAVLAHGAIKFKVDIDRFGYEFAG